MAFWSPHSGRFLPLKKDKPSRLYFRTQRKLGSLRFGRTKSIREKPCRYGYTYPNPMWVAGKVFVFVRGCSWQPTLITRANGRWSRRGRMVVRGKRGMRPYAKYATDGKRVFMAFTECHVGSCPRNSLFYARYAGGYWRRANGSVIKKMSQLPFKPRQAGEAVYDGRAKGGRAWVQDVGFTSDRSPVVLYTVEPRGKHRSSYWYAVYKEGRWRRHMIPFGVTLTQSPGGATLDHETPNVAYVSRKIGARNQVTIVMTPDDGATWYERQITGRRTPSLRPVSPRGDLGFDMLWEYGNRRSYLQFPTVIRHLRIPNERALRRSMERLRG